MNDKPETKINYISPLKRICMTIGELPSSYLETMSYYEMLVWFVEFLKNQVIPVVNNNSEATEELQHLFIELQSYVNNYFDNLDVQDEINNKLDNMVEDGTIDEIIAQIVNVNEKVFYYVEDYGAVGDGETDDSTAINNAFLDAKDKKGTIAFKTQNTYKIDSPIYIPQGCSLYGNGCTILSSVNGYAIYVNSTAEDNHTESVGRSFSILRHFNLESTNNDFVMGYNGIHFACHGIVQYIQFYKIDKCVRFARPLYVDKFKIEFCNASTRTLSSNYAFDLGDNGDAHEINNVQQTNAGSTAQSQPKFIYIGNYLLNSKMSNIIGNGFIDVKGECDISNIMLTYYGILNIDTNHKNISVSNVYASTDYINNGRIRSNGNYALNLNNCRFILNYVQTGEQDLVGFPITFTNTDHVYINQCEIGMKSSTTSSNFCLIDIEKTYGHDLVNPSVRNYNADVRSSHSSFGSSSNINGILNGEYTYATKIIFDTTRMIGTTSTRTKTQSASNKGIYLSNFTKNAHVYLERTNPDSSKVSAYFYLDNNGVYDNGTCVNGIPWSNELLDTSSINTYSKIIFTDINVIAYKDSNFAAPSGTWTKNDIIIANDGIKKFDGTNWI